MDYYYIQPKYFTKFRCIAGRCGVSCCTGWDISWSESEVERLKTINCPDDFRNLIEKSFNLRNSKDGFYSINMILDIPESSGDVSLNEAIISQGRCPFHDEETGLCRIQKDYGEKYLGGTCTRYPRRYFQRQQSIIRSCSTSCPAVINLLLSDKNAISLDMVLSKDFNRLENESVQHDTVEAVENSPYLMKRVELLDFYIKLFNKFDNLEDSIILGALVAKKISDSVKSKNDADLIPTILNNYENQFASDSILESIKSIQPNYDIKFIIVNNLIYEYFGTRKDYIDISLLHNGERLISERYLEGKQKFEKVFKGREFVLRNISANMFLDIFVHLNLTKKSFFEMYSTFTAFIAVIQVFAYAIGYESNDVEPKLVKVTSMLNRSMSHNRARSYSILNKMKELGLTTPAHLALIIK